jgi:hypothetical protein
MLQYSEYLIIEKVVRHQHRACSFTYIQKQIDSVPLFPCDRFIDKPSRLVMKRINILLDALTTACLDCPLACDCLSQYLALADLEPQISKSMRHRQSSEPPSRIAAA